ncbi:MULTISPECIES: DUF4394 domain-containing protein [Cyanophyceae]|uniref:DUF4394 domain-containing protein n=1 Tax=Cyanophyceae TaxID=3028117 RepID=UPI0016875642|nr:MULTISPECIES: DUF4394 domain-containing protein [Cyanophyceae]MBD1914371.1 DUF4394 domain-containing protein [Phormidium sp. FACHB-77]MBD2028645.1 DUF4394 domain-containing protein [Phormidium sp. FACHB-322]MBD2053661.1 DUF4394 domain-containing protein [Leptolyngbya sp. FACHB-60]
MSPLDSEALASETAPVSPQPITFAETDDAGEQIDGAVSIISDLAQPLAFITGTVSGDADLFQIFISGEQPFSATTLDAETLLGLPIDNALGIPTSLLEDPQLFLFDAAGNGIYGNDDLFGSAQATLPSRSGLLTPGIYYLAISGFDYDPISTGGEIFADESFDGVLLPTGSGAGSPLVGFAGEDAPSGNYTIALTGAQTVTPTPPPAAFDLLGLTDNNQLVSFSTDNLVQTTTLSVTGIEGTLIGIDVRPANGLLYGLTTTNQLYTLALKGDVAEATLVSTLSQPFEGSAVSGFDFNPVADRLRLVGENDQSFRINVDTGAVTVDGTLTFGSGDVNVGVNPSVTGAAYTNSFAGTTATQLFDLDAELDSLVLQNPPNDGTLQTVGGLGFDLATLGGFEIVASSAGDNTAFVVSDATLYALNLESGTATSLGAIGTDDMISFQGLTTAPSIADVEPLPELFDLTGFDSNVAVNVIQQLSREAFFDNVLAFYETDALGRVDGLLPGDAGYEAAVAANLLDGIALTVGNNQSIDVGLNLLGGTYYAPALLIDGNIQNLATVGDAALGQTRIKREGNTLLFEDAGDFDFNDLIVTLSPEVSVIV